MALVAIASSKERAYKLQAIGLVRSLFKIIHAPVVSVVFKHNMTSQTVEPYRGQPIAPSRDSFVFTNAIAYSRRAKTDGTSTGDDPDIKYIEKQRQCTIYDEKQRPMSVTNRAKLQQIARGKQRRR